MAVTKRFTFFFLLLAAALSAWSILSSHHPVKSFNNIATQPDTFMEDVTALFMNKEGHPKLKIQTPKMIHYLENDTTHLQTPHVTLYRKSPNPWFIDSNEAIASSGINQIVFDTNVVIHHISDSVNPETHIKTVRLTIFPNTQIAETDQPITIMQPDTTIRATGMLTDLNKGTIKLLSHAEGEYVPTS